MTRIAHVPGFDTLSYVRRLKAAGVDEAQAEAHAEAVRDAVTEGVATKDDLDAGLAAARIDSDKGFAELKADVVRLEDKMATKDDVAELKVELKADVAALRVDLDKGLAELKADVVRLEDRMATKDDVAELKAELKADVAELKVDVANLETRMTVRFVGIVVAAVLANVGLTFTLFKLMLP